jgi:hypothetical protein
MGDNSANATCTVTPPFSVSSSGCGTTALSKTITLSGESGTITLHYTGSFDTGSGDVAGQWAFQRFPLPDGKYVKITLVQWQGAVQPDNITIPGGKLAIRGRWKPERNHPTTGWNYRVFVSLIDEAGGVIAAHYVEPAVLSENPNIWYDWSGDPPVISFDVPNEKFFVKAELKATSISTGEVHSIGPVDISLWYDP